MEKQILPVRIKLDEGAQAPHYASANAAGADVYAYIDSPKRIQPGTAEIIPTGMYLELPDGYEAQIRPRSGLAAKFCVTVLNTPGTIDSDYRGEVRIILMNHGKQSWVVNPGERIAQMVIQPVIRAEFSPSKHISDTPRGAGGFGSTGR